MTKPQRIASFILGFILVGAGVMKFTTGHAFQYIEAQSGLDFFYPYVNHAVGAVEIAAGILIRFRRTRRAATYAALSIVSGAVAFHLTPWLGINTPSGLVDGAAAPWDQADFTTSTTPALFITAIVSLALAVVAVRPQPGRPTGPQVESTRPAAHAIG